MATKEFFLEEAAKAKTRARVMGGITTLLAVAALAVIGAVTPFHSTALVSDASVRYFSFAVLTLLSFQAAFITGRRYRSYDNFIASASRTEGETHESR